MGGLRAPRAVAILEAGEFAGGFPFRTYPNGHSIVVRVLGTIWNDDDELWEVLLTEREGNLDRVETSFVDSKDSMLKAFQNREGWLRGEIASINMLGFCVVLMDLDTGESVVGLVPKNGVKRDFAPRARVGEKVRVRVVVLSQDRKALRLTMHDKKNGVSKEMSSGRQALPTPEPLSLPQPGDGG